MAIVKDLLVTGEASFNGLNLKEIVLELAHPVGSYYWSSDPTDPSELFGGTWTQITGKFLYASTRAGDTGGASAVSYTPKGSNSSTSVTPSGSVGYHTVTTSEMPSHYHAMNGGRSWTWGDTAATESVQSSTQSGYWGNNALCSKTDFGAVAYSGSGGSHNHGFTGNASSHGHTFTGTAASIATMPPYITAYCWRRTA